MLHVDSPAFRAGFTINVSWLTLRGAGPSGLPLRLPSCPLGVNPRVASERSEQALWQLGLPLVLVVPHRERSEQIVSEANPL